MPTSHDHKSTDREARTSEESSGDDLERRLGKIAGQVRGVQRMAAEDRSPEELLLQLSAVQAAILEAASVVLRRHVRACLAGLFAGDASQRRTLSEELMRGVTRFARASRDALPAAPEGDGS